MYFYVDGDNCPGMRTVGIQQLTEKDSVKVFFANNNKYYSTPQNRKALKEHSKCQLEFIPVQAGTNATDFAIAVHVVKDCETEGDTIVRCMVSGDKHFDVIQYQIAELYGDNTMIKRVESIEDGVARFFLSEVGNLQELQSRLIHQYGGKKGLEIYEKIRRMAAEPSTKTSQNENKRCRMWSRRSAMGLIRNVLKRRMRNK